MRGKLGIAVVLSVVSLAIAGITVFGLYRASQQIPEFYTQAISQDVVVQQKASEECLQQAAALASDVRKRGQWQALFTAEQINGWMAVDLDKNFSDVLTPEIHDPRVAIEPKKATLACRYEQHGFSSIFSLTFDAYLSAPNVVAVRIRGARAGLLPVPLSDILAGITEVARNLDLPLQWRQSDGDAVALITIPPPRDEADNIVELETIELRDGALFLAGRTDRSNSKNLKLPEGSPDRPTAHPRSDEPRLLGADTKPHRQS